MAKVLVLRTCAEDMTSNYGRFTWPKEGVVECQDWDTISRIGHGHGLHGALWGTGSGHLLNWKPEAKWLVLEVEESEIVDVSDVLGGSCAAHAIKFPRGNVIYCGNREEATKLIYAKVPVSFYSRGIIGLNLTVGHHDTAIVGYGGTAIAGDYGRAIAGNLGTAIAGKCGYAIAGDSSLAQVGDWGYAIIGHTGKASAGLGGTIVTGVDSDAILGKQGRALIGERGTVQADENSVFSIQWGEPLYLKPLGAFPSHTNLISGYIDLPSQNTGGLDPNVPYRFDREILKFVKV